MTCIHLPPAANAASRPPDYRDDDDCHLHKYWSKLLLIIRPVSMAAADTEKADAAAAARRLKMKLVIKLPSKPEPNPNCRKTRSDRLKRSERRERDGTFSNFLFSA